MTRTVTGRRGVLVVVALVLLAVGLFPLLKANAAARQHAWEDACTRAGAWVVTEPPEQPNPLIIQTGHPVYQCRAHDGRILSTRD